MTQSPLPLAVTHRNKALGSNSPERDVARRFFWSFKYKTRRHTNATSDPVRRWPRFEKPPKWAKARRRERGEINGTRHTVTAHGTHFE